MCKVDLDLGSGHTLYYVGWSPDRELNPQYEGLPDIEKSLAVIDHLDPSGNPCQGAITFDSEVARKTSPKVAKWTVESWEPLTVSPSILCQCGDHGYIREGRWVSA